MSELSELRKAWEDTKSTYENNFKAVVLKGEEEKKEFGQKLGQTTEKIVKMEAIFQEYEKKWEAVQAQKAIVEQQIIALKAEGSAKDIEHEKKLEAMEAAIVEMKRLPAGGARPKVEVRPELANRYSEEKSFSKFLRVGEERMSEIEKKGLASDSDAAGGYLITPQMATTMIELNVLYSPLRTIANVMTIATGDTLEVPKEGSTAFAAAWSTETELHTETTAGTFALARIPTHELRANPWVTQKMIDDSGINIEDYVARKLGQQFAKAEGTAFITGTGVGRPQGLANGGSTAVAATASDVFTALKLIALFYSLEEPYASNSTWVSSRANFGNIRTLTAATDNFLWQPGLSAGDPPTLLGRPYLSCNDVDLYTAGPAANVIYVGDFKAGYTIVDRIGTRTVRDPFTKKPNVEFTTWKRVGGQVVLPEAIKIGLGD